MAARALSGKPIADAIKDEVSAEVKKLGFRPGLAVVRVGEDPASAVYVASKVKTTEDLGMHSEHIHLSAETSHDELLAIIKGLNCRDEIDGILVQLPLPGHIDDREILEAIDPAKDVDGFHPMNVGRLSQGREALVPCTPAGVIEILKRSDIPIAGQHAVIVGRSNIVGKPMAMLLLQENATVTICHSRTRDLASITRQADIIVAAIGRPGFIRSEHIGEGATVVDVGINSVSDPAAAAELFSETDLPKRLAAIENRGATLVGDVNPKEANERAGAFTPVPGGVGLLTVAMLMKNTVDAAKMRRRS
ncbi:MAG TPA: bifunctional methylenetetrahydrofolate dehydrogenase/methenyltetrahydrofolate cyclohydrolase FolD [Pyrinomonadaceae bacterium]|nr:bifunctional methylenetetrahydrofolate dehydrogenase/methenyltetrahydrofolate cyclohydrolase FolD [Chloracidobacterium sp.]HRJ87480.1 bifunctional methylenetetrahydrofolate dehydrogenase/methenyltetrahydrofolate cyclohydrolase FolD [Pyrinomonadaceae bacterium]HRK49785.1 bifunctional methylenetetrahydrofolate dehydrogenase/methenyltetrahydrofolate cyclohydrolase FolD [Pyrinomonadaceae bacterium]